MLVLVACFSCFVGGMGLFVYFFNIFFICSFLFLLFLVLRVFVVVVFCFCFFVFWFCFLVCFGLLLLLLFCCCCCFVVFFYIILWWWCLFCFVSVVSLVLWSFLRRWGVTRRCTVVIKARMALQCVLHGVAQ